MLKKLAVLVFVASAALASAQFFQGTQGLGEVIGRDGVKGKSAFGILRGGPSTDARSPGLVGFFDFSTGSPAGGRMVTVKMLRPAGLFVKENVAEFGGPAILTISTQLVVQRYEGWLKARVRDLVKPGSPLDILDEIRFEFVSNNTANVAYKFDGWMNNGSIEVFGGWPPLNSSL